MNKRNGRPSSFLSIRHWAVLCLFIGMPWSLGEVVNSQGCTPTEVEAAIAAASKGDTVRIPAGTCKWDRTVVVSKDIALIGAGMESTILLDNVPRSRDGKMLEFHTAEGSKPRLSGLTLRADGNQKAWGGSVIIAGRSKAWRLDHVKFDRLKNPNVRVYGYTYGVIDHCVFDLAGSQGIVVWHESWGGAHFGDGSWADRPSLGSRNAVFIEDNVFNQRSCCVSVVDSMAGGRFVFRYNQINDEAMGVHGTESTNRYRSVRTYEIYNNRFSHSSGEHWTAIFLRGGTGVVFNNQLSGYHTVAVLDNFRSRDPFDPWGECDGSNPYDGNQAANGYPCIDQVGRGKGDMISGDPPPAGWPNQDLEPVYGWNNTLTGRSGDLTTRFPELIQEGRDFFNNTPKPGYSPYLYPHPLVEDDSPPSPPQGLKLSDPGS